MSRLLALVIFTLAFASAGNSTTLGLLQPDASDITRLQITVDISDGFTSERAFDEVISLVDRGSPGR